MSRGICRLCAHVNADGARFCNECGSPLTLLACPDCDAINALDAPRCHQCGASLATTEQAADAPVARGSEAMSVPSPASGAPLQAGAGDSTPIALAERFERERASTRDAPRIRPKTVAPAFDASLAEAVQFVGEPSLGEPAVMRRRDRAVAGERDGAVARVRPARSVRQRLPLVVVALIVLGIAAGSYYGWLKSTSPNMRPPPAREAPSVPAGNVPPHTAPVAPLPAEPPHPPAPTTGAPSEPGPQTTTAPTPAVPETPAPQTATTPTPATTNAASPAPAPATPDTTSPTSEQATPPSPSSSATSPRERRTPRARPTTRAPRIDKDAEATQRLIERDLGRFVPNGSAK